MVVVVVVVVVGMMMVVVMVMVMTTTKAICDAFRVRFSREAPGRHLGRFGAVLGSCGALLGALWGRVRALLRAQDPRTAPRRPK